MNNLGTLYEHGEGVAQDYVAARKLYEQAAAKGEPMAVDNLGVLYLTGRGVPQDLARARQLFEQAAARGSESARTHLAAMAR